MGLLSYSTEEIQALLDSIGNKADLQTNSKDTLVSAINEVFSQGSGSGSTVSPTISISSISGGHRVTVEDVNGSQYFDVMDGTDGQDGVSPSVSVSEISGGHRVTITDASGPHSFDVMDGEDGAPGSGGSGGVSSFNGRTGAVSPEAGDYTAGEIGAGTFPGRVVGNAAAQATLSTAQLRNITAGTTDLTAGSSSLTSGTIYIVYE